MRFLQPKASLNIPFIASFLPVILVLTCASCFGLMDTSTSTRPSLELRATHKSIVNENHPQNASHIAPLPTAMPDLLEQGLETDLPASSELTFDADAAFPEGGRQAWLCVCGAFFLLLSSFGFMVSIGTLQAYWETHQLVTYSTRDIGWIPSVFVYLGLALGIWVGPVFDRYGPRLLVLAGSGAYTMMLLLLAECSKYWQFMLCLGVMGGFSAALIQTAALSCIGHWFKRRRGLATGVAMMGMSVGGVIIPLLLRSTFSRYSWKWAIRILAFAITGCLVIGNAFIRGRLKSKRDTKTQSIISLSIFGDMRFTFLTLSIFSFEIVLFGSVGILPTYARVNPDYPPSTGFYLISVLNGLSSFGRMLPGLISDSMGTFNVLSIMLAVTLLCMLVLWLPLAASNLAALYAFCALFGFGTGSWMSLTPLCIGQLCEAEEFGRHYGTSYFIAGLATLICVPISGQLIEVVGADALVGFFCAALGMALLLFVLSRWACLGWRWQWWVKV